MIDPHLATACYVSKNITCLPDFSSKKLIGDINVSSSNRVFLITREY